MDISFIYFIKTLLLPLSSLLFLALSGLLYPFEFNQTGKRVMLFALFGLYLLAVPVVAIRLATWHQSVVLDQIEVDKIKPQAIVVLGGGTHLFAPEYSQESTVNAQTLLRLRYAAKLVKQLGLPLLVSGGNVFNTKQATEAELMAAVLQDEFNTPVRWLEDKSRNTAENAFFTHQILQAERINPIILVTHAIHMPRAVTQFERVGFKVVTAPTVLIRSSKIINWIEFLPSAQALELSTRVIHEWLGQIWYKIRY